MLEQTAPVTNEDNLHEVLMQLEAIIFASDAPVSLARLKESFQNQYSKQDLRQFLQQLAMLQHGRSIELIETAQGFRFQVRAKYRQIVAQTWPERPTRLSPSLLEMLAVVAYHQPVTRADIEQIRESQITVNCYARYLIGTGLKNLVFVNSQEDLRC